MHEVTIAGRTVPYRLVRNARSRHVRITFTPDGLRVSAPMRLPDREIRRAVQSKEHWLLRHEALLHPQVPEPLIDGQMLPFLDGAVELGIRHSTRGSVRLRPDDARMAVAAPGADSVRALVERGYRGAARDWFTLMCDHHASHMDVAHASIGIRDPHTRWGSCSARGALSFSWRLMMAPARVAEYVVVHEMAHLTRLDHSPAFWDLVHHYSPDFELDRRWLRDHGDWLSRAPGSTPRPPLD
ncbi:MAG: SprT family zinc-dependent metalloprotease [Thermoleophilia bacterium]